MPVSEEQFQTLIDRTQALEEVIKLTLFLKSYKIYKI